jgi:hypothetical protein
MYCNGETARNLWHEIRPYKNDTTEWTEIDKSHAQSIWFGAHSQCSRTENKADGSPGGDNDYWCNIWLDLLPNVAQGLR